MYKQTLYKVIEPIKLNTIKRLNKSKKWEYGYNKENDVVVISKTGMIGEILEIQGFKIALPKQPIDVYSCSKIKSEQKWKQFPSNPDFKRIKTVFDWQEYPAVAAYGNVDLTCTAGKSDEVASRIAQIIAQGDHDVTKVIAGGVGFEDVSTVAWTDGA